MIGWDTNVLVRYIAQDEVKQSPKATQFVESLTVDKPSFISLVALVELVQGPFVNSAKLLYSASFFGYFLLRVFLFTEC